MMNADGTNPHVIAGGPGYEAFPHVSPDGKKLAFQSDEAGIMEIYVQDLTTNVRTRVGASSGGNPLTSPAWSPDSKRLAYSAGVADSKKCIVIVNANGTGKKYFASGLPTCTSPSWSPDGTELGFKTWRLGTFRIARGKVDVASTPLYLTPHSAITSDVFLTWSH